MNLAQQLGLAVRAARQQRQLTTRQLAALAGLARSTVEKLEAGDGKASLDTAQKVLDALGLVPQRMLQGASLPLQARVSRRAVRRLAGAAGAPSYTRESEAEALRNVLQAAWHQQPVQESSAHYRTADVAALLAAVLPSGEPSKMRLKDFAVRQHGDAAKAAVHFSVPRLKGAFEAILKEMDTTTKELQHAGS